MKNREPLSLATAPDTPLAAVGANRSLTSIWNLLTCEKLSEFATLDDRNGTRLVLVPFARPRLIAASLSLGVACYDAFSGTRLWQRSDLKNARHLSLAKSTTKVFVGFPRKSLQEIDAMSGVDISVFPNVRTIGENWFGPLRFLDTQPPRVVHTDDGGTAFMLGPTSSPFVSACFSPTALILCEYDGPVTCYHVEDGRRLWQYQPPAGFKVTPLTYSPVQRAFFGVLSSRQREEASALLRFDEDTGQGQTLSQLGRPVASLFCLNGKALLVSTGELIDTGSGDCLARLPFIRF